MQSTSTPTSTVPTDESVQVASEQRTQFFIFLLIAMCLVFAISYTGRVLAKIRVDSAVAAQQDRNVAAQERTAELQDRLAYVQSDAYVEEKARSEFGMAQPGDKKVVILPQADTGPASSAPPVMDAAPQPAPSVALPARETVPARTSPDRSLPIWRQWLSLFRPEP